MRKSKYILFGALVFVISALLALALFDTNFGPKGAIWANNPVALLGKAFDKPAQNIDSPCYVTLAITSFASIVVALAMTIVGAKSNKLTLIGAAVTAVATLVFTLIGYAIMNGKSDVAADAFRVYLFLGLLMLIGLFITLGLLKFFIICVFYKKPLDNKGALLLGLGTLVIICGLVSVVLFDYNMVNWRIQKIDYVYFGWQALFGADSLANITAKTFTSLGLICGLVYVGYLVVAAMAALKDSKKLAIIGSCLCFVLLVVILVIYGVAGSASASKAVQVFFLFGFVNLAVILLLLYVLRVVAEFLFGKNEATSTVSTYDGAVANTDAAQVAEDEEEQEESKDVVEQMLEEDENEKSPFEMTDEELDELESQYSDEPQAEEEPVEEETEEEPVEEEVVEEEQPEETEEVVEEEVVEEEQPEETEEVVEEEVVEEEQPEETEEPVEEQPQEVVEVVEEQPEEGAEEDAEDEDEDEADDEAEDEAEDEVDDEAAVVEDNNREKDIQVKEVQLVDEDGNVKKIKKKFNSRMMYAPYETKEYYNEVKNYLQSYRCKGRMSARCETFRYKGLVAKVSLAGKSLKVYLALQPSEFENTKYHFKDVSDKKQYAEVPMMIKVRSNRGLKYFKELVDILMGNREIKPKKNYEPVNYLPQLVPNGEAILAQLGTGAYLLHDNMNVEEANVDDIKNALPEDLEEYLPAIQDEPLEDEEVEAPVYLDTLCNHFEDGDQITIDVLKSLHIVTKGNVLRIKARGTLDRKLIIYAEYFEEDALRMLLCTNCTAIKVLH